MRQLRVVCAGRTPRRHRDRCWPYPRAFLTVDGQRYLIERCEQRQPADADHGQPGVCSVAGDTIVVRFSDRFAALQVRKT